ncbi:hypothetical protein Pst134EA_019725 [Puccinia striiformis f. sp. tritici]|uniref:hypothetical protein n=1 Tax=Puccinia striiformis f. sp. tritici TaxID=168172 RepID=UPI0020089B39|nr:hypothetical protein Pst134EA_019725 [Puccinia striiformis f. sp. tritici]KAH9459581.1 hypothetical protein Pst134EA_019725 [Puccinia striiformis f. sp. tritici]
MSLHTQNMSLQTNAPLTFPSLPPSTIKMTGPEKAGAMISVICGLCRKVKQLSNTIKATPQIRPTEAAVISSLSHAEQVRTFTFTGEFKEFLRQSARENLLDYTVEAYGNDDNERSLYRAVLSALLQQTPQYKRLQLPPKYPSGDRLAVAHVMTEVKTQLKHVRNKLRNVPLTGITGGTPSDVVPNISQLSRLVWRHVMGAQDRLAR